MFKSFSEARPSSVAAWNVRLVGLDTAEAQGVGQDVHGRSFLSAADLAKFRAYPRVVAIVSYDEPTEASSSRRRSTR